MDKLDGLITTLIDCGSVVVAFSGGTDSSLLAAAAGRAGAKVLLATAVSPLLPPRELAGAEAAARRLGLEHRVAETGEWFIPEVRGNLSDRCYHCKRKRFTALLELAAAEGYDMVVEGSNSDDLSLRRPGLRAIKELGIRSPLLAADMGKEDILAALREMGLSEFIQPSRSCLATRFPYGTILDSEELRRVDEVEEWLEEKVMGQVRARRPEPGLMRIEADAYGMSRLASDPLRSELLALLERKGFRHALLDLRGYRSGSMDEGEPPEEESLEEEETL